MPAERYDPAVIEPKWQRRWLAEKTFRAPGPGEPGFDPAKKKRYILDMFPYPSGSGLHVGHPEGYTATDILCRFWRMRGENVLHPMGWDAFGLPAEQYAIESGTHPAQTTQKNVAVFRRQIQSLGFSYDWEREVDTTDPGYYRWTQWIFLQMYNAWYDPAAGRARPIGELPVPPEIAPDAQKKRAWLDARRLAYLAEVPVWWCEALGTVLANEEVLDGRSERGDHPCVRRPLKQWMLRITAYAERLLADLARVNWPEGIKEMQRNWIGRSEGAEVDFVLASPLPLGEAARSAGEGTLTPSLSRGEREIAIRVYTTRPDTLFGATYMVLAPEHPLVERITTAAQRAAVEEYRRAATQKSDLARTDLAKEKTGVFTGAYAYNPVFERSDPRARIPVWIADYVLMGYGTGAIMAVPAHDERDWEFARKFGLPIVWVVKPPPEASVDPATATAAFVGDGLAMNSGRFDNLPTTEFKKQITDWLAQKKLGAAQVTYRLRDWLFSRQRYWGEPFPVVHCAKCGGPVALPEQDLPVLLPPMQDFRPTAGTVAPLERAGAWLDVQCPACGGAARRETNTMPQWAGSCWYYLRYLDPRNEKSFVARAKEQYWMPVDLYVGGAEHAVLHLLYARFWHKVLHDLGHVSTPEPFGRLFNQGMILSYAYRDARGALVPLGEVEETAGGPRRKGTGEALVESMEKMSKALKNVINPDEVVREHGADTLRLYEMFMGPLEAVKPWNTRDVSGVRRFLERAWRLVVGEDDAVKVRPHLRDATAVSPCHSERSEESQPGAPRDSSRRVNGAQNDSSPELEKALHRATAAVTEKLEHLAFNTAISALMEFVNAATPNVAALSRAQAERFVLLVAPFAPHLAEELWERLGHAKSLAYAPWPSFDPGLLVEATVEVPVQVNGKVRARVQVAAGADDAAVLAAAREAAAAHLAGKALVRELVVRASAKGSEKPVPKLVTLVVK